MPNAAGRLVLSHLRLSAFEFGVVHRTGSKHEAAGAPSRMLTYGARTTPIRDDIPFVVIEITSNTGEETTFQQDFCQADAYVVQDKKKSQEQLRSAPAYEEFLRAQLTDSFCQQSAAQIGDRKAELTNDENRLIVGKTSIDGAIEVLVPSVLRKWLLRYSRYPVLAGHCGQE